MSWTLASTPMRTGWHCSSTSSMTNAEKVGNLLSPCLAWFSRTLVPYLEWAQLGRILTSFLLSFSLFNGPYPQLTAFLICKFLSSQQTPLKHFHPSMKSSIIVLTCLERPEQKQKGVQIVSLKICASGADTNWYPSTTFLEAPDK